MAQTIAKAEATYKQLEKERQPFLDRARDMAKLTIPHLVPDSGHNGSTEFKAPYQSLGARGVKNLAAKLLVTLLPPNEPCFRLMVNEPIDDEGNAQLKEEVKKRLAAFERAGQRFIETSTARSDLNEGLKQLIVAGNVLKRVKDNGGFAIHTLDTYCVRRDNEGNLVELVVKEEMDYLTIKDDAQRRFAESKAADGKKVESLTPKERQVTIYTHVKVSDDGKGFTEYQEIKGEVVPGSESEYTKDNFPWIVLRWTKIPGEDYGRSLIEEHYGDLLSYEELSKAIVQGTSVMAKIIFLNRPNGMTLTEDLARASTGDIIDGDAEDVSTLQVEKHYDFRVAKELHAELERSLALSFMLNTSIQRRGERVTAEEIRYMAREIEDAFGGLYSVLSLDLQTPYVKRVLHLMKQQKIIPELPKDIVQPVVVTGMDALGRGHDLDKLDAFIRGIADVFGPEAVAQEINVNAYLSRRADALGVESSGLVKTLEEKQAEAEQAQQMAMLQQAIPQVVAAGGKMAVEGMKQQQPK